MIRPFIDAHVHLNSLDPEKIILAGKEQVRFVSINTNVPEFISIDEQLSVMRSLFHEYPDIFRYAVTFSMDGWEEDGWLEKTIYRIQSAINEGAIGVKIWKDLGMEVLDKSGSFLMIDDDRLDPLFSYLESHGILVLGHQGEPRNCWLPLDEMTVNSDRDYFESHPEYHMYLHPEYPSYDVQIQARDNRLRKNPNLRFVGLHLFSVEYDIDEVAKRLDEFPNAVTDLAERICHLQYQSVTRREDVRNFLINYQDRVIYGTDVIDDGRFESLSDRFTELWSRHWSFFAETTGQHAPEFDSSFMGLGLPESVLEKIFYTNAARLYGFTLTSET